MKLGILEQRNQQGSRSTMQTWLLSVDHQIGFQRQSSAAEPAAKCQLLPRPSKEFSMPVLLQKGRWLRLQQLCFTISTVLALRSPMFLNFQLCGICSVINCTQ